MPKIALYEHLKKGGNMDYNVTYRKRNGKYQCIISYKTSSGWKQKSKQGTSKRC